MAIDLNDDILQDFLVEAGEILETLGEQLVELERSPHDQDLLNAVFRGFHTVKGGAGFLALNALVEVCHCAEDVFNLLRQGERQVTPKLMDVILQVTDVVNDMMDNVRSGIDPEQADPALLAALEAVIKGQDEAEEVAAPAAEPTPEPVSEPVPAPEPESTAAPAADSGEDITDDEFEALLDELQGKPEQTAAAPADEAASDNSDDLFIDVGGDASGSAENNSDEITEEEFEALLDQLHGDGSADKADATPKPADSAPAAPPAADDGNITDEEFDALLDELDAKKESEKPAGGEAAGEVAKPVAPEPEVKAESKPDPEPEAPKEKAPAAPPPPAAKQAKEAPPAETTVRVDTKRLDDIMNLVGELVLVRNRMATLKTTMSADEEVGKAIANLDIVTSDLQTSVMKTRMQPIKKVFGRFPRVVRDLARSLKKEINLELMGEETDLDKNLVEALADPLVHLVRNAVDHGVEMPDEREAAGKERIGTVLLSAQQEGDHILLIIEDDGKGMDADVLRAKAVEKGIMDEDAAARLDNKGAYNLIFAPGFSTKTEISDVSGRGVGMDVVKTRINQLNGSVEIDSELGKGSRIVIKLPLTLAIMPTLMVGLGAQIFALPLANVNEIFDMESARRSTVDGKEVVIIREKAVPLVHLGAWLVNAGPNDLAPNEGYVVVTTIGGQHIGCIVDNLVGQEEVVIKPLGAMLHGTKGISGATITGNGGIALILDMPGLLEAYANRL
ncbi:chemotaxis protein CheW [Pseudomonadota bacterium]